MSGSLRLTPAVGAILALLAAQRVARAETGAAEALFRAGREAAMRGEHDVACAKFAESERLEPAVGTELNLALCEEQLRHLVAAWRLFRVVIDRLPPGDTRRALARRHLDDLDVRVPRVTLKAATLPQGTEIRQGSTWLSYSSLGVAIPVDVGEVEFVVASPERMDRRYRLMLSEGARETLEIEPGDPVPHRSVTKLAQVSDARPLRSFGVIGVGVGAALLTVGGAAGLAVLNARDSVEHECDGKQACSPRGIAAAQRGKELSLLSTISFAAGAGFAGLGAWLWLQADTRQSSRVSFQLGPGVAWVHGRF